MKTHAGILVNGRPRYLCNRAVPADEGKICARCATVTCKNCLRMIWKLRDGERTIEEQLGAKAFYGKAY